MLEFMSGLFAWGLSSGLWAVIGRSASERQIRALRRLAACVTLAFRVPGATRLYETIRQNRSRRHEVAGAAAKMRDAEVEGGGRVEEDAVVLFSGGKDCTAVAWLLAGRFRRVHLLSVRLASVADPGKCEISVARLRASRGPESFVHPYVEGQDLFWRLHFRDQAENVRRFGRAVANTACIACHLGMLCQAVAYARERGIRHVGVGLSPESRIAFEQSRRAVEMSRAFAARCGLTLHVPLWDMPGPGSLELLRREKVIPAGPMGKPFQYGRRAATQGFCPLGLWGAVNMMSHRFRWGIEDYYRRAEQYRVHLEKECAAHLAACGVLGVSAQG
jgi:7-cyano-7-deazaguanine synthase in queuosine biosynthesis